MQLYRFAVGFLTCPSEKVLFLVYVSLSPHCLGFGDTHTHEYSCLYMIKQFDI